MDEDVNCCVCLALAEPDATRLGSRDHLGQYGYVPADTTIAGYASCRFHAELLDVCATQLDEPPLRMALRIISGKLSSGMPAYDVTDDLLAKYRPTHGALQRELTT